MTADPHLVSNLRFDRAVEIRHTRVVTVKAPSQERDLLIEEEKRGSTRVVTSETLDGEVMRVISECGDR
jgi:hypothetical protein